MATTGMPAASEARRAALERELERLRQLLAADPRVRRLFLFGSLATGTVHEWSDLDVLVVMETDPPFIRRAREIRERLRPAVGMDIIVYTPDEYRLMQRRRFVREEMLAKGKVVPLRPVEEAREWLVFATEDLTVARLALGAGVPNQACFHAQQCVEKCLEALLVRAGQLVPRTHRVSELWNLLSESDRGALVPWQAGIERLDDYYAPTRYPDAVPGLGPSGLPDRAEAAEAVASAAGVGAVDGGERRHRFRDVAFLVLRGRTLRLRPRGGRCAGTHRTGRSPAQSRGLSRLDEADHRAGRSGRRCRSGWPARLSLPGRYRSLRPEPAWRSRHP